MNTKRTVDLSAEEKLQLNELYKKVKKFSYLWGGLMTCLILFAALSLSALLFFFSRMSTADRFVAILIFLLLIFLLNVTVKYLKFFYNNLKYLKKDNVSSQKNLVEGILEKFSVTNNHIELIVNGEKLSVKFGIAFLGYSLEAFSILVNQFVSISYLENSHLLYEIQFKDLENGVDGDVQINHIAGVVTYAVVHKIRMKLNGVSHAQFDKKIQIGNKLLFWFKPEIPPVGSYQEIQLK